jgi:ethanolaminephosphotransferase
LFVAPLLLTLGAVVSLSGVIGVFRQLFHRTAPIASFASVVLPAPRHTPVKTILVVVDALRHDLFVDHMPATQSLANLGHGRAWSDSPTVTRARIRALMRGDTQVFLQVIENLFGRQEDTILAPPHPSHPSQPSMQSPPPETAAESLIDLAHWRGLGLVLRGDDTWAKEWPSAWRRAVKVESFFVTDTEEVDEKVHSGLHEDVLAGDWDVLVAHYLGLDHIGHLEGPRSKRVAPKLQRLDRAVADLHALLEGSKEKYLIAVVSDHGMNDAGNHGGGSEAETSAVFAFVGAGAASSATAGWRRPDVRQVDLAPTLAYLWGLPVPKFCAGVVIPGVISRLLGEGAEREARERSALQRARLLSASSTSSTAPSLSDLLEEADAVRGARLEAAERRLAVAADSLAPSPVNAAVLFSSLLSAFSGAMLVLVAWPGGGGGLPAKALSCLPGLAIFFSSSFVEEEHLVWYLVASTMLLVSGLTRGGAPLVVAAALLRGLRAWNQTGNKHYGGPDARKALEAAGPAAVQGAALLSLVAVVPLSGLHVAPSVLAAAAVALARLGPGWDPVPLARVAYVAILALAGLAAARRRFHLPVTLLSLLLHRLANWPAVALIHLIGHCLSLQPPHLPPLLSLALLRSAFFSLGNSNSFATLDMSGAYTGLSSFYTPVVALLACVQTFSGPMILLAHTRCRAVPVPAELVFMALVAAAMVLFRDHLFVWSVFAPRFFYQIAWLAFAGAAAAIGLVLKKQI